jgi:hypothetical protein
MDKKFWMVYRENGEASRKCHNTKEEAITEARRLAGLGEGRFFILEVIGIVCRPELPIEYTEIKD